MAENCFTEGQKAIGYIEKYAAVVEGMPIQAIVNYLPEFPSRGKQREAHLTLIVEGVREQITDGLFHRILDDLTDMLVSKQTDFYRDDTVPLKYAFTQWFLVETMPDIQYFTHGEYACEESDS